MIQTYKTKLIEKKQLTADTFMFRFQTTDGAKIDFIPGQYLILFVPQGAEHVRRLFSVSTAPGGDRFELLVKIIPGGIASEYLTHLTGQEEVMFQGPAGMFALRRTDRPIVFLATGTGLAPIRSILLSTFNPPQSTIKLFWGLRTGQDAYYLNEFEELKKKNPQFSYSLCFSRDEIFSGLEEPVRSSCSQGRIPQVMDTKPLDKTADYYLCGGREAVETFREYLTSKGIDKANIFFEKF